MLASYYIFNNFKDKQMYQNNAVIIILIECLKLNIL